MTTSKTDVFLAASERIALARWHECTNALLAAYVAHNPRKLPGEISVIELLDWSERRQRALEEPK